MTDANAVVTFQYDKLGRRRTKTVDPVASGEPTLTSEWHWRDDLQGRLDFDSVQNGPKKTIDYDDFGRVKTVTHSIGGEDFVSSVEQWDTHGRPQIIGYPGDAEFRVENFYDDASGILKEVKAAPLDNTAPRPSYWKLDLVDGFGQVASETFGGGTAVTTRTYRPGTGLPDGITTTVAGGTIVQQLSHSYYDSHNLQTLGDAFGSSPTYTYDEFGRVDKIYGLNGVDADFEYTNFGSIKTNQKGWAYGYDADNPNSVQTIEDVNANTSTFQYNTDGTLKHRSAGVLPELNVEYTSFAKPKKVWEDDAQAATQYDYDANETKVTTTTPNGATVFAGGLYYRERTTATGEVVHHYLVNNGLGVVAEVVRTVSGGNAAETSRTLYHHPDRLGSVQVITDSTGTVVERRNFSVFGADQSNTVSVSKLGYTGQWQEADHGLVDMGGRFYDPQVGQFLSSDPVIASALRSESFNLKAYVSNNPLRFVDPTGFQQDCDELSCGGGSFGGTTSVSTPSGNEGAPSVGVYTSYGVNYSEAKYRASLDAPPILAEKLYLVGLGGGAALGVGAGFGYALTQGATLVCLGSGVCAAVVVSGVAVVGTGYAIYNFAFDGGVAEVKHAFTKFETRKDALVVGSTLVGGVMGAKALTNVVTRRLAGGAFLTTFEDTAFKSGHGVRGLGHRSRLGGYFESTTNAAGGEVITSVGKIEQVDFIELVDEALARGEKVYILSGVEGHPTGFMQRSLRPMRQDLYVFGGDADVHVLDVSTMSDFQIGGVLEENATIIGGFCDSGACLAPFQ